ncbi:MAG: glyceraldehyde-3-phosphate dehydrogenase, partial [Holosporales bacterium]|nr:glyceraldehyde-3-phosphate dehydrogenase [Holosporales bacterium]
MVTMVNIGINGFGRIGRMCLRAYYESCPKYRNIRITYINDLSDKNTNIHLLKYDSIHGNFPIDINILDQGIEINGDKINMISEPDPEKINWAQKGVDLVFECSGRFTQKSDAEKHIKAGAKKIIISAPSEGADITVVFGINHNNIQSQHKFISNGSCTTNCLAPIAYLIHNNFGIECGFMTTIHSYTGDQRLIDTYHKDLRRARSAPLSIIPSSTGAAKAIGLVIPELKGKLDGTSIRVPTSNVSMIDLKCNLLNPASIDALNQIMKDASETNLQGILRYNNEPLVSCDFNHSTA